PNVGRVDAKGVGWERFLRISPGEELDCAAWGREKLAGDLAREACLIGVLQLARADVGHCRDEGERDQNDRDRPERDAHTRPVAVPAAARARRGRTGEADSATPVRPGQER